MIKKSTWPTPCRTETPDDPEINLTRITNSERRRELWEQIKQNEPLRECVEAVAPLAKFFNGEIIIKLEDLT